LFWLRGDNFRSAYLPVRYRERRAFDKRANLEPLVNDRAAQSAWIFAAVPVIANPLAFRRAAEATNGPAVQRLTLTPPHRPFFAGKKIDNEPPADRDFSEIRNTHLYRLGRKFTPITGSIR
jgi:hypothetical protein